MTEETNQPPYGSKRAAAMAIYTPPFVYQHGYIFDSQRHMVADNGPICDGPSVEGAFVSRVRGWGRIDYMPNAAALQDEVGQMMADALNALYQVPAQGVPARILEAALLSAVCPECGSTDTEWHCSQQTNSSVVDGRLRMHDVHTVFFLGCNECSETIRTISGDKLARLLTESANAEVRGA